MDFTVPQTRGSRNGSAKVQQILLSPNLLTDFFTFFREKQLNHYKSYQKKEWVPFAYFATSH